MFLNTAFEDDPRTTPHGHPANEEGNFIVVSVYENLHKIGFI